AGRGGDGDRPGAGAVGHRGGDFSVRVADKEIGLDAVETHVGDRIEVGSGDDDLISGDTAGRGDVGDRRCGRRAGNYQPQLVVRRGPVVTPVGAEGAGRREVETGARGFPHEVGT